MGAMAQSKTKSAPAPKAPSKPASSGAKSGSSASASHTGASANGTHSTGPTANGTHTGATANGTHTGGGANANATHGGGANANASHGGPAGPHGTPQATKGGALSNRPVPKGATQTQLKGGSAIQKRPNGRVSDVHDAKRGMDVHHGLNGSKQVSVRRPDGSRVVGERGRRGYVERGFHHGGHDYARRSYYYHGRAYDRYYRGYYYGGVYMNVYAPGFYYGPGFYGWAYNPWYSPISYSWGWGGSPWFGFYGGFFTPYPVYASASFWLTDYLISTSLQAEYAAQQEAGLAAQAAVDQAVLDAQTKQMIADEVKAELALENAEAQQNAQGQEIDPASSGLTRMFSDGHPHVFVAGSSLDVVDAAGNECALSDSDALQLTSAPPAGATTANLVVLASKGGKECPKSDTVTVNVSDLQEMQNHMRETIDQGLQDLQAKQGKGGLPQAPPSAQGAPVATAFTKDAPPPEQNGAADVNQQLAQSDQAEQEVTAQAAAETGGSSAIGGTAPAAAPSTAAPVTVALGQTVDQVTTALGQPTSVIDLGTKKIYKYPDMKVTFKAGKVADVQ
jgi:hypothetical protein